MLILFVLLALQITAAAMGQPRLQYPDPLYGALLFVPIGVGVMRYWDLLRAQARACPYLLRHQYAGGVCSGELGLPFGAWRT
ncbi:hypothetical protein LN650_10335 [Klebsiella pneumoniae subsp. pneumoniae]|nr:hypothetical protein [Klebsiella pneumoniae subsp. pneumoniae]